MNQCINLRVLTCTIILFFLTACGQASDPSPPTIAPTETAVPTFTPVPPTSTPTPTPTLPPICQSLQAEETPASLTGAQVVEEMVAKLTAGDVAGAMAYFSEDALAYFIGIPPAGFEAVHGKAAICGVMAKHVSDNLKWNLTITSEFKGLTTATNQYSVKAQSEIWLDSYQQAGVISSQFNDTFHVIDGKITDYAAILTEDSLAEWRPFIKEFQAQQESLRAHSPEAAGSDFNVVFSDFECTFEGPSVWKYGKANFGIEVKDHSDYQHGYVIINLDQGYDYFDLAVATDSGKPSWVRYADIFDLRQREKETTTYTVAGINKYLMCFSNKEEHIIGLLGPFPVVP